MNFTKAPTGYLFLKIKHGKSIPSPSKQQPKNDDREKKTCSKTMGIFCGENNENQKESKK